ncbi:DUF2267 domain-containing protein [Coralliovum pocilloporae]|uniref:DUF2267 domain-containing protein n=1 Tax=Coralliovum pocilloporae TaxID=3066369 RepID=UPI0033069E91
MDDLIARVAQAAGIDEGLAQTAVKIILNFLNKEGPADQMSQLLDAVPGARNMIDGEEAGGGGGLLGGLMGGMGAMAALNELTSSGLDMSQIQGVTRELMSVSKEAIGEEAVDEIVNSIPGLSQVL